MIFKNYRTLLILFNGKILMKFDDFLNLGILHVHFLVPGPVEVQISSQSPLLIALSRSGRGQRKLINFKIKI
jgi:hypothetical protein